MATDIKQRLREALVAVLDTAAAIAALTGRASENLVSWNALEEATRPVLVYRILSLSENGESGEGWDARVQLTAVAEGNNADATVEELLGAVCTTLTAGALLAAGVDAAPIRWHRADGSDDDQGEGDGVRLASRNLHVAHSDVELTITA